MQVHCPDAARRRAPPPHPAPIQGPLSGFESHRAHHATILAMLATVQRQAFGRGALEDEPVEDEPVDEALPGLQAAAHAFLKHAEEYDALYAGHV